MYHKGTYGDLMIVPGLDEAIVFAHTGDNLGPPSADQAAAVFHQLHARFPEAAIDASTMDCFAQALARIAPQLPRVTAEIGNTWIHGTGSDPGKVWQDVALCRLRRQWLSPGAAAPDDARLTGFSRALLCIPEHTWGLDEKTHLADYSHYAAADFQRARRTERFPAFRGILGGATQLYLPGSRSTGSSPFADEALQTLARAEPVATPGCRVAGRPVRYTRHDPFRPALRCCVRWHHLPPKRAAEYG